MKLSVNLNKVALLRNARGENYPDLKYFANKAIDIGVDGLTLHPRPDHRHVTSNDVIELSKIAKNRGVEFNIEGNPFSKPDNEFLGFCELVKIITPDQITLVPDAIHQITSDHGWARGSHDEDLKKTIELLKESSRDSKVSLFIDDIAGVEYASEMNADLIEIYTGKFSNAIGKGDMSALSEIKDMIDFLLPRFTSEGKSYVGIAIGCTGGKHRSVVMAEEVTKWLKGENNDAVVLHRDMKES